jgi:hypothetical protein
MPALQGHEERESLATEEAERPRASSWGRQETLVRELFCTVIPEGKDPMTQPLASPLGSFPADFRWRESIGQDARVCHDCRPPGVLVDSETVSMAPRAPQVRICRFCGPCGVAEVHLLSLAAARLLLLPNNNEETVPNIFLTRTTVAETTGHRTRISTATSTVLKDTRPRTA